MHSWSRAILLGLATWLIPFTVGFFAILVRDSSEALFESIMAVAVASSAVVLGGQYLKHVEVPSAREGLRLGLIWLLLCILLDAPLFLLGLLMHMSVGEYMADIGLTYVIIPVVTWGLACACRPAQNGVGECGQTGKSRA